MHGKEDLQEWVPCNQALLEVEDNYKEEDGTVDMFALPQNRRAEGQL